MRHIPSTFKLDLESSNQIGSSVDSSCQPHQTVFEQDANRFLCKTKAWKLDGGKDVIPTRSERNDSLVA